MKLVSLPCLYEWENFIYFDVFYSFFKWNTCKLAGFLSSQHSKGVCDNMYFFQLLITLFSSVPVWSIILYKPLFVSVTPLDADQFILGCFFRFHMYEFYRLYLSLIYSCVVASLNKMIWLCFSLLIFWFSKSCQHSWCFLNLVFLSALYLYFSIYSLFLLYLSLV